jgi:hypothetical protein
MNRVLTDLDEAPAKLPNWALDKQTLTFRLPSGGIG